MPPPLGPELTPAAAEFYDSCARGNNGRSCLALAWSRNYVLTGAGTYRLQERTEEDAKGAGVVPSKGDRYGEEQRDKNECMTPVYCARSNDIRDIRPAS